MIKDISLIQKELKGYVEVELPFEFQYNTHIKYITLKDNDEAFFQGGKFKGLGNDCILLTNQYRNWSVPICNRLKDGSICYESRFFIQEEKLKKCTQENDDLQKKIIFQQNIIQKLTNQLQEYEHLLQENRYSLKDKSIECREKEKEIKQLKYLIHQLQ